MARNRENTRQVRRAAHAAYLERLRLRRSPRSDDLARAILAVIRESHAQIVNIGGGREVLIEVLRQTHDYLEARGFRREEVRRVLASLLTPQTSHALRLRTPDVDAALAAAMRADDIAG
jgi:hypothetical protein